VDSSQGYWQQGLLSIREVHDVPTMMSRPSAKVSPEHDTDAGTAQHFPHKPSPAALLMTPPRQERASSGSGSKTDQDKLVDSEICEVGGRGRRKTRITVAPNPDIARFRPPSSFSLSGPLVHIFISYRAESEKDESDQLYDAVINLSKEAYPIPPGARGRPCPLVAAPKWAPHICKVFLDRHCLLDGRDWEAGFVLALAHSIVAVPLLSWGDDDTGSVGQMVSLQGETDREDNVLLEFMLMLALKSHAESSMQAIYPVLMGTRNADGSFAEFPFAELQRLPDTPSAATSSRAAKIMHMLGLPSDLIHDMRDLSVRDTVYTILRSQGCKLSTLDVSSAWQDQCASKLVLLLLREVRALLESPSNLRTTRPCAEEMLEWLQECGLQQLAPVFTSTGLSSLEAVATISGERVRKLCRLYAQSRAHKSVNFDEDLYARFEVMRDHLKSSDLRARCMEVRLDRFVDNKVSWATAINSTSAFEIGASHWLPQLATAALLGFNALLFLDNLQPQRHWQGKDRTHVRWVVVYVYQAIYLVIFMGLGAFLLLGYFLNRPLRGKNMLQNALLLASAIMTLSPVVELAQILIGSHDAEWSFSLYLWNTQMRYSIFLYDLAWSILYFGTGFIARRRQEHSVFCPSACFVLFAAERSWLQAFSGEMSPGILSLIILGLVFCTGLHGFIYYHTKSAISQARRTAFPHAQTLNKIWTEERNQSRDQGCGKHNALQLLGDETLRIEQTLDAARRQAMSRARSPGMLLRSMLQLPQEGLSGSKRYSVAGKVRQRCSDIGVLFVRAAIINDVFQDYFRNLVNSLNARRREVGTSAKSEEERRGDVVLVCGPVKKPERALQKCVRVFRRDAGCLTDLVRCTIVAQTIEQVYAIFSAIRSVSVVHSHLKQKAGNPDEAPCPSSPPRRRRTSVLASGEAALRCRRSELRGEGEMAAATNQVPEMENGWHTDDIGVTDETRLHQKAAEALFRITACKDRFREGSKNVNSVTCFRNISLNLEVGFVFDDLEGEHVLVPLPWEAHRADTLICEVQIHLASLFYSQGNQTDTALAHRDYIAYRNLSAL
jgi:hypothetical protein